MEALGTPTKNFCEFVRLTRTEVLAAPPQRQTQPVAHASTLAERDSTTHDDVSDAGVKQEAAMPVYLAKPQPPNRITGQKQQWSHPSVSGTAQARQVAPGEPPQARGLLTSMSGGVELGGVHTSVRGAGEARNVGVWSRPCT